MFKKLVVPVFVLGLATYGCSSDSTPNPGTGGTTGKGGTTGSAGTSAAGTTGTAGTSAAGTTGTAGTSAGGTTGTGGTSAGGTTGTAGAAGGSAGRGGTTGTAGAAGGTAGAGGGTAGAAGGSAGRGGTTGTAGAAGGSAGAGGGTAGTTGTGGAAGGGAGTAGGNTLAQAKAKCNTPAFESAGAGIFTSPEFCALYLDTCLDQSPPTAYMMEATCLTAWTAVTTTGGSQPHCRSYHLCNAQSAAGMDATHCPHATGMGQCQ